MIYIFDLDGTLADTSHRLHLVKNGSKHWSKFYSQCVNDSPNKDVISIYNSLRKDGNTMIIFTGRRESSRHDTQDWLKRHEIIYSKLLMRPEDDFTSDHSLKKKWLYELKLNNNVAAVFDDRGKVVDMWRREGITCLQVAQEYF